jgi:hypothetical protein
MGMNPIRVAYLDQFVAKDPNNTNKRKTILDFNKFMIQDDILDIYMKGLYINREESPNNQWPNYTYLLPPKI